MRLFILFIIIISSSFASSYPNACTIIKSPHFLSNLDFSVKGTTCGSWVPRPCARISYRVPETYIEIVGNPGETFFKSLPIVQTQLKSLESKNLLPYGTEAYGGSYFYQAHTIDVPFTYIPYSLLPCGGTTFGGMCLTAQSEHLGDLWKTGKADLWQPTYLAWMASPKACLIKGAAMSVIGSGSPFSRNGSRVCSFSRTWMKKYPPSTYPICTGWGIHFPRTGSVQTVDQTTASLVIASRIKSLGSEVFLSVPNRANEVWSMVYPTSSRTFREGHNIAMTRANLVNDLGRITKGIRKNYLYTTWRKVSCKVDWPWVPFYKGMIGVMQSTCGGF